MNKLFLGFLSIFLLYSVSIASDFPSNFEAGGEKNNSKNNNLNFLQVQQNLIGEAKAIDSATGKITLKPDSGSAVTISTSDKTIFRRVSPGQTSIANAETISLSAINIGDRILIPSFSGSDQTPARQVIVMARTAITAQRDQEREARRARTFNGRITVINSEKGEIIIQSRGRAANAETLTVSTSAKTVKFQRYAPDSLKPADAVAGTFSDLRVGDQIRIIGDRVPDGQIITAEEIFSGSVTRTVGTIVEVNAARNEVLIKNSQTGKTITVMIGKNTSLRRISDEMAETLKQQNSQREERRRQRNVAPQTANGGNTTQTTPEQQQAARNERRANRQQNRNENGSAVRQPGQGNRGGFGQQFENLPAVTIAELKKGDAVLITATGGGADNSHFTAVSLVTGAPEIQPILQRMQGGRNGASPNSPGLPGNVSGGNSVNDDEPRN